MRGGQARSDVTRQVASSLSDVELLWLIAQRDHRAMEELFGRHEPQVSRFALRLVKNDTMAEDIAAETFCQVWQGAAARFGDRSGVQTWLFAIARHLGLAVLRRRSEQELDDALAESLEDPADGPEAAFTRVQQCAIVARCVDDLPPVYRDLIRSFYFQDMSVCEIAADAGAPPNTVKTRMARARVLMAELLRRFDLERAAMADSAGRRGQHVDLHV
jgi:RNA polymerase sigma-70 factor (ECF subfamily)